MIFGTRSGLRKQPLKEDTVSVTNWLVAVRMPSLIIRWSADAVLASSLTVNEDGILGNQNVLIRTLRKLVGRCTAESFSFFVFLRVIDQIYWILFN